MSNYANLKSAIQNVIKTNGNNEITGQLLQNELLAMITTLGYGYQFMGVASPDTVPGTPDAKVFYIAYTPGTYTNFGGIAVTGLCVLKYATNWVKEDIPVSGGGGTEFTVEPTDLTLASGTPNKLKFADRPYNTQLPDGLGYKILRKDSSFSSQVTDANTIYVIRYVFDLDGGTVNIPAGCVLQFDGGKITNGTIAFNNTILTGVPKILTSVSGKIVGTANVTWFVDDSDLTNDIAPGITKASTISTSIIIPSGTFNIKTGATIDCTNGMTVVWDGDVIYDGVLSAGDIITIKGGSFNLKMGGTFSTTAVGHLSENKFDIVAISIINCYRSFSQIGEIRGFNVGIKLLGSGAGCVNNTINLGRVRDCNIGILLTQEDKNSNQGWANENLVMGGKIMVSSSWNSNNFAAYIYAGTIPGSTDAYNKINGLSFYKINTEGVSTTIAFYLNNCGRSSIVDCRTEGDPYIKLVGTCSYLYFRPIYNTYIVDYSEITKSVNAILFRDPSILSWDYCQSKISLAKTPGVIHNGYFYTEAEFFYLIYNSANLNYTISPPAIVNDAELDFASVMSFRDTNIHKILSINPTNVSGARRFMYFKIIEVDGVTTFNSLDYVLFYSTPMTYYQNTDRWQSGADFNGMCQIVFHAKVKKVLFGFKAVSDVDIQCTRGFTLLKNTRLHSGATADRPTLIYPGFIYYDTDLGKPITWNGTEWVNMDGSALT